MKRLLVTITALLLMAGATTAKPYVRLLDREVAVRAVMDTTIGSGLVTLYSPTADPRGKVALVLDDEQPIDAAAIRRALVLALGIVLPQPRLLTCSSATRGEACTGDARGVELNRR